MKYSTTSVDVCIIIFVGLSLRSIASLHSYSGENKPPLFGDYEAQRHWQEITTNLNPKDWYKNSSSNDLLYWGLDYPPLTAYHSYLLGAIGKRLNESFVELGKSQGFESESHKTFMRLTVLLSDALVYIPGVLTLSFMLGKTFNKKIALPIFFAFMLFPGQILIDNGHFQYNNISLGLAALTLSAILADRYCLSAFFFTLALNYKQMELYHALTIFFYLLRISVSQNNILQCMKQLLSIGSTVVATFIILWLPWIQSGLPPLLGVLNRIFPVQRGIFEDKVSNLWCAVNVVYKLKQNFTNQQMAWISFGTTAAVVFPLNIYLFIFHKKDKLIYCLFNTAIAFFLLSFQVHEKSILLVSLPAICLLHLNSFEALCFLEICTLSMFPLFIKDNLVLPFFSLFFIFHFSARKMIQYKCLQQSNYNLLYSVSTFVTIVIAITSLLISPPFRYPHLWPLIISIFSCFYFALYLVFGSFHQIFTHSIFKT